MMNETTPSVTGGPVAGTTYGSNLTVNSKLTPPTSAKDVESGATPTKTSPDCGAESNGIPKSPKAIIVDTLQVSDVAQIFSMENFRMLKNYVSQGEKNFKLIAMAASIALILRGFFGFFKSLFSFYLFGIVIDILILVIGMICILYEYDERKIPIGISTYLHSELHIFSTPYGRSIITFCTGLLLLQQPLGLDTLVGLAAACGGGFIFFNMRKAELALASMKDHISDDTQLRALFDKCDLDKSGFLDKQEVCLVCRELGTVLNNEELKAALTLLDSNGDGNVSYEEFKNWYEAHK